MMSALSIHQPLTNAQIERRCRAALRRSGIGFRKDRQRHEVYNIYDFEAYTGELTVTGIFGLVRYTETIKEKRVLQRELMAERRAATRE